MQYSFAIAALGASAVMAAMQPVGQIVDGQLQVSTGGTPVTSAPVQEQTVYSTKNIVITSCGPEVVSCPARSYKTSSTVIPIVVKSSSVPVVVPSYVPSVSYSVPNSPIVPSSPVYSAPVVPVYSTASVPLYSAASVPVYSAASVRVSGTVAVPVYSAPVVSASVVPSSPNSPIVPSAPAVCPTCPTCPAAVTVTVTATPIPAASSPVSPVGSYSPNSPASPAVSPAVSSPASPYTPNSPAQSAPVAVGTAASTGVTPYSPSSSPITPFKGAASSLGSSIAMAGLAAFAAIVLA